MKCPVCTGSARDVTLPDFDGERIKCDLCGEYDISGTIVFRLSTFNIEERKEALSKAKRIVTNGNSPMYRNSLQLIVEHHSKSIIGASATRAI